MFPLIIMLLASSTASAQPVQIPPSSVEYPQSDAVTFGDVYGTMSFRLAKISVSYQQSWLLNIVKQFFGLVHEGEYIIVLEVKGSDDKPVARKIIGHFAVLTEQRFIWDDKKLGDISKTTWEADLTNDIKVNNDTNKFVYRCRSIGLIRPYYGRG